MPEGATLVWRPNICAQLPSQQPLRAWLRAKGSLTAHLTRCFGPVEVQRLHQGAGRARSDEAEALGLERGQTVFVREVVLRCRGEALVMARSVCELRHLRRSWYGLRGLGSRPLAELLFNDPRVRRGPLSFARLSPHQLSGREASSAWRDLMRFQGDHRGALAIRGALWQRRSVFERLGARLLVSEMFSPQFMDDTFGDKFFLHDVKGRDNT